MQVDEVVAVDGAEELVNLFGGLGGVAEGGHVGGEGLAGQDVVDGRVLVEVGVGGELPHLEHLAHLLVAHELLVHLLQLLLEHEVLGVLQDLLAVQPHDRLPHFLVQRPIHPFAAVLVETLEVPAVHADPLGVD